MLAAILCFHGGHVSWRSSQTTAPTEVQVVPIEGVQQDLSNGRTVTSVGPAVDERRTAPSFMCRID